MVDGAVFCPVCAMEKHEFTERMKGRLLREAGERECVECGWKIRKRLKIKAKLEEK